MEYSQIHFEKVCEFNKVFNYLDRYHLRNAGDKNLN